MNRTYPIFLILIYFFFKLNVSQAQTYALKSGFVAYELTGHTTGTKKIWWDQYGRVTKTEINSVTDNGHGKTIEERKIIVTQDAKMWTIDLIENTGQMITNPFYEMADHLTNDLSIEDKKALSRQIIVNLGGKIEGQEKIMSYPCDIVQVMGGKTWIYEGVVLKSEVKALGLVSNETATAFTPNISHPESTFTPNPSYEYVDLDALQDEAMNEEMGVEMDEDSEDSEASLIPLTYRFEKFKSAINSFAIDTYSNPIVTSGSGMHMAVFSTIEGGGLTIAAMSNKNPSEESVPSFNSFTHKGHLARYGLSEDETSVLMVDFPEYEMVVILGSIPIISQQQMCDLLDKISF